MPVPPYNVGESVTHSSPPADSMIGTGFGPSYYIVNPGTVIDMTGIMIVEWDNGSISLYEFDDPGLNFIEPTPP